jgi:hypothetical protein
MVDFAYQEHESRDAWIAARRGTSSEMRVKVERHVLSESFGGSDMNKDFMDTMKQIGNGGAKNNTSTKEHSPMIAIPPRSSPSAAKRVPTWPMPLADIDVKAIENPIQSDIQYRTMASTVDWFPQHSQSNRNARKTRNSAPKISTRHAQDQREAMDKDEDIEIEEDISMHERHPQCH